MENFPFHAVDVALLAVLMLSALVGFTRGIVREGAVILAVIVAVLAAIFAFPVAKTAMDQHVTTPAFASALALIGLFAVVFLICRVILRSVQTRIQAAPITDLNKGLGFVFGFVRAAVLACLALLFVDAIYPVQDQPPWLKDFQSRPLLKDGGKKLVHLVSIPNEDAEEGAVPWNKSLYDALRKIERPENWQMSPMPKEDKSDRSSTLDEDYKECGRTLDSCRSHPASIPNENDKEH